MTGISKVRAPKNWAHRRLEEKLRAEQRERERIQRLIKDTLKWVIEKSYLSIYIKRDE